jgi:ubiquinone/menaquinone biosynthesis C-methylase UbiE
MSDATGNREEPSSSEEWRNIARVPNLYYHILSWPEKEAEGWTAEEFYATGDSEWADFKHHWSHYSPGLGGTCVEIGCGAGRLTQALARDFERVVALDVSPEMIATAREAVPENVDFELVDATTIPLADGGADAVFSVIVLQHLETFEDVRGYLKDAYRALAPGGSVMVNISLAHRPRGIIERTRIEFGIWRSRRGLKRGKVHEFVRWREYPWENVMGALREIGYRDIQLRLFPVRSNGWQYHFWLATKPRGQSANSE